MGRVPPIPGGPIRLALVMLALVGCGGVGAAPTAPGEVVAPTEPVPSMRQGPSPEVGVALPTLAPHAVLNRVPTRVRVPKLDIDLPVIQPPPQPDHFPFCDVAEYLPAMSRPGRAGTTYLYAHARPGMFLPILESSTIRGGASMIGLRVEVYSSDERLFTYQVTDVRRHVTSLDFAYRATVEQLILQTSEGPPGTAGKTMLIAAPRDEKPAAPTDALPEAKPVPCV
jgi:hypothetical protein